MYNSEGKETEVNKFIFQMAWRLDEYPVEGEDEGGGEEGHSKAKPWNDVCNTRLEDKFEIKN